MRRRRRSRRSHSWADSAVGVGGINPLFPLFGIANQLLAALVCWRAVRSPEPLPTTETPYVRSRIVAPAGLFPTEAEKRALAQVGAGTEDRG